MEAGTEGAEGLSENHPKLFAIRPNGTQLYTPCEEIPVWKLASNTPFKIRYYSWLKPRALSIRSLENLRN